MYSLRYTEYIFLLAICLSTSFCFNSSDVDIVAYSPKGVSISIPYENEIKNVKFYGKLSSGLNNSAAVEFRLTDFRKCDRRLVALDENVKLFNGHLIYTITKTGKERINHTHSTDLALVRYPISITAFDPQGFRVNLFNDTAVEGFLFWANVNEPLLYTRRATIRTSALEATEGSWIVESQNIGFLPGDFIYPAVHIRRNGSVEKYPYLPAFKITELVPNLYPTVQIESTTTMTTVLEIEPKITPFMKEDQFTPKYKNRTREEIDDRGTIQTIAETKTVTASQSTVAVDAGPTKLTDSRTIVLPETNEDHFTPNYRTSAKNADKKSTFPIVREIDISANTDNPLTEVTDIGPTKPLYSYTPNVPRTKEDPFIRQYKNSTAENSNTNAVIQTVIENATITGADIPVTAATNVETTPWYPYTPVSLGTTSSSSYKFHAPPITINTTNVTTSSTGDTDEWEMEPKSFPELLNNFNTSVDYDVRVKPASVTTSYTTVHTPFTKGTTKDIGLVDYTGEETTTVDYQFEYYKTFEMTSTTEALVIPPRPDLQIVVVAYDPKGLSLLLYASTAIDEFYFWANINEEIDNRNNADIKLSTFEKIDRYWTVFDDKVKLNVGDVLNSIIYVKLGSSTYSYPHGKFVIKDKIPYEKDSSEESTTPNVTKTVRSKAVSAKECRNNVVLNAKDVVINFSTDVYFKKKFDATKLSYVRIEDCDFTYRVENTDSGPSTLKIVIV